MIHWNFIVYGAVALCSIIVITHNFFSSYYGGMWAGGKRRFKFDFVGYFNIIFLIVWTLVWGGVYWW